MIRYFSGPFFHHPGLLEYDYYWRVEPDVDFFCTLDYDPFVYLRDTGKLYGFNMMVPEFMPTVKTLYDTMMQYFEKSGLCPQEPLT